MRPTADEYHENAQALLEQVAGSPDVVEQRFGIESAELAVKMAMVGYLREIRDILSTQVGNKPQYNTEGHPYATGGNTSAGSHV